MQTVAEYLRHAEECDALARTAKTAEERAMITGMAETWRKLAEQRKRQLSIQATIDAMPNRDKLKDQTGV